MRSLPIWSCLLLASLALVACKGRRSGEAEGDSAAKAGSVQPRVAGLPSWGAPDIEATGALLAAELARDLGPARDRAAQLGEGEAEPEILRQSVLSFARIGGRAGAELLIEHLDGAGPKAVAAPGLLDAEEVAPDLATALETTLWSRYALTDDPQVRQGLAFSLARLGGPASVARFSIEAGEAPPRRGPAFMALGILCSRGSALTDFKPVLGGLVLSSASLSAAAFAASRCIGPSAELLSDKEVRGDLVATLAEVATTAEDVQARRLAFRSLAALGEAFELPAATPASLLGPIPDSQQVPAWLVEVEGVRALAASGQGRVTLLERLTALDLGTVEGARVQVLYAALVALAPSSVVVPVVAEAGAYRTLADRIAQRAGALEGRGAHVWAFLHCHARMLSAAHDGDLAQLRVCGEQLPPVAADLPEVLMVDALLYAEPSTRPREERIGTLLSLAGPDKPSVVRQSALSALAGVDAAQVNPIVREALADEDPGVASSAAAVAALRAVDSAHRDPQAVDALLRLAADERVAFMEARVSALGALANLLRPQEARVRPDGDGVLDAPAGTEPAGETGAENALPGWVREVIEPLAGHPHAAVRTMAHKVLVHDPEAMARSAEAKIGSADFGDKARALLDRPQPWGLSIETTAGQVVVDFSQAVAPLNQRNLASLAEIGHFTDTRLHRVVPGFVVQGGDPRGDGYGGPGYFVPCERSSARYERGTVGIALAGKDTGGSQFFITHAPQPHLDGRYTVVGQVSAGMDVVDTLMPTDQILSVKVLAAAPVAPASPSG